MCGLMGVVTTAKNGFTQDEMNSMQLLLWITQLRGRDSTGVAGMDNKKNAFWQKKEGTPDDFFTTQDWKDFKAMMLSSGEMMFGHCRAATKGTVNEANAHPFMVEKPDGKGQIILAHNGTLWPHQTLPGMEKFEVDSHWLAHCVATLGVKETFSRINGPIATMWLDTEDNSFNVFRNNERPLSYFKAANGTMLIQSEREWLEACARKAKLHASNGSVWSTEFRPEFHYKLVWDDNKHSWKEVPIIREVAVYQGGQFPHRRRVGPYGVVGDDDLGWEDEALAISRRHSEGVNVFNAYYQFKRGLNEDIQLIFDGKIRHVHFTDNGYRITKIDDNRQTQELVAPYKTGLKSIYSEKGGKEVVHLMQNEDGSLTRFRVRQMPKNDESKADPQPIVPSTTPALLRAPDTEPQKGGIIANLPTPCYPLKYKKGRACHWKIRGDDGEMVRHKAICSYDQPRLFTEYENSVDGKIVLGKEVIIEVNTVVERVGKLSKCIGYAVSEKQDRYIEYSFFDTRPKEEILAITFFKGVVNRLFLTSKERWKVTKSVVEAGLREVIPVDTSPVQPADEIEVSPNVFH